MIFHNSVHFNRLVMVFLSLTLLLGLLASLTSAEKVSHYIAVGLFIFSVKRGNMSYHKSCRAVQL